MINQEMMKRILATLFVITGFTFSGMAQKYGEDSVRCVQNLSLYRDYYKQKVYEDAYKYWKIAYKICPESSERMYVDGANLVEYKMKNAKTAEEAKAYTDTLLQVYDKRIQYFGNEGYVLGRKGTDMLRYVKDDPEAIFSTLEKSFKLQGEEAEAGAIMAYMTVLVSLEKAGAKTADEVVTVFSDLSDVLSKNIAKWEGKNTQKYYISAQENVEELAGPYLSCEKLQEMATKGYEENKDNAAWMERTANMLDKKGCVESEIFFKIANKMHSTNPSAVSAEKMGIMSLKKKNYDEAVKFFQQALEMGKGTDKEYDYHIELAQAYSSKGNYPQARSHARKAAELKPSAGLPYIMIGDMVAASSSSCGDDACKQKAVYWLATDYYIRAKNKDASVAESANSKIATYSKYFPTKEECFFIGIKEGDTVEIGCWIGESTKARF